MTANCDFEMQFEAARPIGIYVVWCGQMTVMSGNGKVVPVKERREPPDQCRLRAKTRHNLLQAGARPRQEDADGAPHPLCRDLCFSYTSRLNIRYLVSTFSPCMYMLIRPLRTLILRQVSRPAS